MYCNHYYQSLLQESTQKKTAAALSEDIWCNQNQAISLINQHTWKSKKFSQAHSRQTRLERVNMWEERE
jgi:hypothetical protein